MLAVGVGDEEKGFQGGGSLKRTGGPEDDGEKGRFRSIRFDMKKGDVLKKKGEKLRVLQATGYIKRGGGTMQKKRLRLSCL